MNPDKGIYKVGGAVRDILLGREPKDVDYLVVGHTIGEFLDKHPGAKAVGKSFPVFLYQGSEYAFARVERKVGAGHGGFHVVANPTITLLEDLSRRDLTINAMALGTDGRWFDPFGGQQDLQDGVLRHVGPAFSEDPLRVYRLARFRAKLFYEQTRVAFNVAPETMSLAASIPDSELLALSAERVCQESRLAMQGGFPGYYWHTLKELGKLHLWHKELADLVGVPAGPPQHHGEPDSFVHTMMTLNFFNRWPADEKTEILRWAALLHDLGKGVTPREKWPSHPGHDETGVPLVEAFCDRLRLPNNIKKAAMLACREHMRVHVFLEMRKTKWVDVVQDAEKTAMGAAGLAQVCKADVMGRKAHEYDCSGAEALEAVIDAVKEEKGHPIPASLKGKFISLHVRAKKGAAAKRALREKGIK